MNTHYLKAKIASSVFLSFLCCRTFAQATQTFSFTGSAATLSLLNELGQTVKIIRLDAENEFSVELSGLAGGSYFLVGEKTTGG